MTSREYPVVIHPLTEEDGGGFIAIAPDLPGCMGDGATAEEALKDAYRAVDEWIDEAQRLHRAVPAPDTYAKQKMNERAQLAEILKKQERLLASQDKIINEKLESAKRELESLSSDVARLLEQYTASERTGAPWPMELAVYHAASIKRKSQRLPH